MSVPIAKATSVNSDAVGTGTVASSPNVLSATSPELIMTAFSTGDNLQFVELYNQSAGVINAGTISIKTKDSYGVYQDISLANGYILPKHFVTFSDNPSIIIGSMPFSTGQAPSLGDIVSITMLRDDSITQTVNVPKQAGNIVVKDDYLWAQHKQRSNATIKQTGDFATDFSKKTSAVELFSSPLYHAPASASGLKIFEVNPNPADCSPMVVPQLSISCGDYVKVVNSGDAPVNLTQFRLRSGAYGDSVSITNSFNWQQPTFTPDDEYLLNPHDYIIIHLRDDLKEMSLTAGEKYVWVEDYYGTVVYDSIQYPDMTLSAYSGKSWALNTTLGAWQPAVPNPYGYENIFIVDEPTELPIEDKSSTLQPCTENQYRSTETNRCRSIVTANALQPCKDGQYRSEETNRCRSIVQTVAASLKPCGEDQFRNPESGRCKKIASTEDILAPCNIGWERNPETNRCRKVATTSEIKAPYAVEPVATPSSTLLTFVTIGGLVAGGMLYAAWEWRREMSSIAKKLFGLVTTLRK